MGLISLLLNNPALFLLIVIPLLYSVIMHEVAHGWVAYLFGDDTAKRSGRLSFNPASHLDPLGTLMLFVAGFGWAKPVPVDYYGFRNSRLAFIAVSLAGCAANIIIATISLFLLQLSGDRLNDAARILLATTARINITLGAFNLIPLPPLDGSKILMGFLSEGGRRSFALLEPYGFFILLALLVTGLLDPAIQFFQRLILFVIAVPLGVLR